MATSKLAAFAGVAGLAFSAACGPAPAGSPEEAEPAAGPLDVSALVGQMRDMAWAEEVDAAQTLIEAQRPHHDTSAPGWLLAASWLGRGAGFAGRWDVAERYASEARDGSEALLDQRDLDADTDLPLALGAGIEVLGRVRDLAPTHVVVNVDENTREQVEAIAGLGPAIVVTHPVAPEDNVRLYGLIGGLFGREERAAALAAAFAAALADLRRAAARLPRRDVLYLIWKRPWMTVSEDTYVSRFLALANWRTRCSDPDVRYPEVDVTPQLLRRLDLVLFASEPYAFTPADVEEFRASHPVGAARLLPIDGEMTSWYGSRAIEGLRYLRRLAAEVA